MTGVQTCALPIYNPGSPVVVRKSSPKKSAEIANLIILLLEPKRPINRISKLEPEKQRSGIPASIESWRLLKPKYSLRIGISGPIKLIPARMLSATRNIGAPKTNLLFSLLTPLFNQRIHLFLN